MLSCGTDIVSIGRIKKTLLKHGDINSKNKFLNRVFTKNEISFFKTRNFNNETIAGRFAAKEAVIKALSQKVKISILKDIEILEAIPKVVLKENFNLKNISVSISHEHSYAISFCILEFR